MNNLKRTLANKVGNVVLTTLSPNEPVTQCNLTQPSTKYNLA